MFSTAIDTIQRRVGSGQPRQADGMVGGVLIGLVGLLWLFAGAGRAEAQVTATTTTLSVTVGEGAVTTVAAGTVVSLTASLNAEATSVSPAQIAFCDATASSCTGPHLLALAQVTGGGTAVYRFVPGIGVHSYRAVFLGTSSYGASASATTSLTVTGTIPTTTTITKSGPSGSPATYTLTGTVVGAAPYPVQSPTQSVTINLGPSAQNYVLTGTGATTMDGATYGNYYNTQGSCVTAGGTTTCDLTGNFTSSSSTYASGTYDFQTVFTGSITTAITSQTNYPVGSQEPNPFTYTGFSPSMTMTLKLNVTGGGAYSIPVAENGNFDPSLDYVNFADVSPMCGGTSLGSDPCQEDYVGTVPGATYTGVVTGAVEFEMPVPPTFVGPTGTVSFLDTTNANAVLGTGGLGTPTEALAFGTALTNGASIDAGLGVPGDFNGDGKLDLVFTNRESSSLTVLLGKGDGTFTAAPSVTTGSVPAAVALADFDGDGNLDIAVVNQFSNTVTILLGKGDGTFSAVATAPATGAYPAGIVAGDFNGDGIPDLIVTNQNDSTVTILIGNGQGGFSANEPFETTNTPGAIVAGDFNGDGKLDLAIAVTNGVNVYLGRGDGSFALSATAAGNAISVSGIAVADLNGDGKLDLAITDNGGFPASAGNGQLYVEIGNGDGTFTAAASPSVGKNPSGVVATDFNGDGIVDLATSNMGDNTSTILVGRGDGTFPAIGNVTTANVPTAITAGDFNDNGYPDLVLATQGTESGAGPAVSVALAQLTETAVATATGIAPPAGAGNHAVVASYPSDGNFAMSVSSATNIAGAGGTTTASVITWTPTVATIAYGTALGAQQLNATAATAAGVAIPGTFVYTPAAGAVLSAGTQTLSVTFTPTSAAYSAATGTATITVTQVSPAITWATPGSIVYGTVLGTAQLDATAAGVGGAALPGTFVYTPAAGTMLTAGTHTLGVAFTPTDATDYKAASGTVSLVVTQATPMLTWATPAAITPGTALSATQLDAAAAGVGGAALPGTFVYTPAAGTVLTTGTHTLSVAFTPMDATDYKAATDTVQLVVSTATASVITWKPAVATIAYGTALGAQQLNATAATAAGVAIPGTFVYTPAAGTVLSAGTQTLSVAFTPTSAAYSAATGTATITVTQATPVITWATPAAIATGTALSAMQLDATAAGVGGAALPGTFVYAPPAGTMLAAGTQTLNVTFTPTDTVDYTTATDSVPITVTAAGCPVPGSANSMNIAYYTLGESDRDEGHFPSGVSSNYVLPALGAHGLPVYNPAATASSGTIVAPQDLLADNEITWWSPALNNGGAGGASDLVATGTGVVSLPYSNSTIYPPNGTGPDDLHGYQTAVLTGTLTAPMAETVSFSIASDDLAVMYLDGQIACDDGGAHAATAVPCTTATVAAGTHTLQLFYIDLYPTGAVLDFSVTTPNVVLSSSQFGFGTITLSPAATEPHGTSQAITISIPVTYSGPAPTGAVSFGLNSVNYTATCSTAGQPTGHEMCSAVVPAATIAALAAGAYPVTGSFAGDCNYPVATATPATLTITAGGTAQTITFAPLAGTTYGAAPITLAATASSGLPVSYAVTGPAAVSGSTLTVTGVGSVTVTASQAGNTVYAPAAPVSQTFAVTKATPVITWAAPAMIAYGTALSATQLDATVAGVGTGALTGTLVYTPAAGAVLAPGTQTLSVAFTPTDTVDYTGATASVQIVVSPLALSGITPLGAALGSANTTITLTGTGFVPTSVVLAGTTRLATTYVGPTMLTAVVPATLLKATGTLAITVMDPSIEAVSGAQTFTVLQVVPGATLTGPSTTAPGTQPTVGLTITNPYPLALTAQFTLTFAGAGANPVDDPSIQFSTGGRTYSYMVAANSTSVPPVQLQAGTDAGTITITATLLADGVDVTPAGLVPLTIVVPPAVPVISGTTITASGNTLTVVVHGFSNTREVSQAVFDFTAATGDTVATPMLTIPATTIFGTWFGDTTSYAYGSTFTYTQTFNTSGDAKTVGTVKVTLTNSVGVSAVSTSTGP